MSNPPTYRPGSTMRVLAELAEGAAAVQTELRRLQVAVSEAIAAADTTAETMGHFAETVATAKIALANIDDDEDA